MNDNYQITILGKGAWGQTLAYLLNKNDRAVNFWSRSSSVSLASAVAQSDVLISAVSIKGVREIANQLRSIELKKEAIIVTATKGLDFATTKTPSQIWQERLVNHSVVVLCGPNLAKEILADKPATTVVSSHDRDSAQIVQHIFASEKFRVYLNDDPLGTELGGTLKNVMAIASGVCDGLNLGKNAKAALLTRALPEMIRVGTHLGASAQTFFGLSGLGDLLATCDSPLSRNYQVGLGLARGESLAYILSNLEGTAEGINTVEVLVKLARKEQISVPIAEQVYLLLNNKITAEKAIENLMVRELKQEVEYLTTKSK